MYSDVKGMNTHRNDYHQSSERILAEPGIEPDTCSQVRNATEWLIQNIKKLNIKTFVVETILVSAHNIGSFDMQKICWTEK